MANIKISDLVLIDGVLVAEDDVLPIVDTSDGITKKVTVADLRGLAEDILFTPDNPSQWAPGVGNVDQALESLVGEGDDFADDIAAIEAVNTQQSADIDALESTVGGHTSQLATHASQIGALQSTDATHASQISAIQAVNTTQTTDIDALEATDVAHAAILARLSAAATVQRFVSATGNDSTGDGSRGAPYLTVARAFEDMPIVGFTTLYSLFNVRIIPPYTSAVDVAVSLGVLPRPGSILDKFAPTILIDVDMDPANVGLINDARFSVIQGPLTPTAATTENGRIRYTFPGGTLVTEDQYVGYGVRVFNASNVELYRGAVAYEWAGATQQLVVQTASTSVPTPQTTDKVYIVRPTAVLTGSVALIGNANIWTIGIRTTGLTLMSAGDFTVFHTGCMFDAVGSAYYSDSGNTSHGVSFWGTRFLTGIGYSAGEIAKFDHWVPAYLGATESTTAVSLAGTTDFATAGVIRGQVAITRGGRMSAFYGMTVRGYVAIGSFEGGGCLQVAVNGATYPFIVQGVTGRNGAIEVYQGGVLDSTVPIFIDTVKCGSSNGVYFSGGRCGVESSLELRPVNAASPTLSSGLPLVVASDCDAFINTSSTLRGANSVDVKAGNVTPVSYTTLDSYSTKSITDTSRLASIRSALVASPPVSLVEQSAIIRYVSPSGNDTTGVGTKVSPYLTITRAFQDYPRDGWREISAGFCCRLAPGTYAGNVSLSFSGAAYPDTGTTISCPIVIDGDPTDANAGLTNDPRWTVAQGPLTPTAVGTEQGRTVYTFAAATLATEDQFICYQVRIFDSVSGLERFRGVVTYERAGATQQLVVQGNGALPAASTNDRVYIVRPSAVITGAINIQGQAPGRGFALIGVRHTRINFAAAGVLNLVGAMAEDLSGGVTQTISVSNTQGNLISSGTASLGPATQFNYGATELALCLHWVPSVKRNAITERAAFVTSGLFQAIGVYYGSLIANGYGRISMGAVTLRAGGLSVSDGARYSNTQTTFPPILAQAAGPASLMYFEGAIVETMGTHCVDVSKVTTGLSWVAQFVSCLCPMTVSAAAKFIPLDAGSPTLPAGGSDPRVLNVLYDTAMFYDATNSTLHGASTDVLAGFGSTSSLTATQLLALASGVRLDPNSNTYLRGI